MSNRWRAQRATTRRATPVISVDEQIRTVAAYLRLANTNRVGDELGISGQSVRDRLYALHVPLRPVGFSERSPHWEQAVKDRLRELRTERSDG